MPDWRATTRNVRTLLEEEGWVRTTANSHPNSGGLVEENGHIVALGMAIDIFHSEDGVDVVLLTSRRERTILTASNRYSDRTFLRSIREVIAAERKRVNP